MAPTVRHTAANEPNPLTLEAGRSAAARQPIAGTPVVGDKRIVHFLDSYDLESFLPVAAQFGTARYGYVVTPNVDHMIRFQESESFRNLYSGASYILLDSRIAARLFRIVHRIRVPVCTGSDLTAALLGRVVEPQDRVVVIGASAAQAEILRTRYGLKNLLHHAPPMGFIERPSEVEACLRFIEEASPFRYCLIAVGSPRQEIIADALRARGRASGLALCIGASIDFITGAERRCPVWLQRAGLEWLYRLLQNPRRLAYRYLVRGPRFFGQVSAIRVVVRPPQSGTEARQA